MRRDTPPTTPSATAWRRIGLTVLLVVLVWWPARPGAEDDFPLSTYPMFGHLRASSSPVRTVLGVRADGRRVPLDPVLVGGTANPKQALATALNAVKRRRSEALCDAVATRVAAADPPPPLVAVEVVTDVWDTLGAFEPGATPSERRVHARCEVP